MRVFRKIASIFSLFAINTLIATAILCFGFGGLFRFFRFAAMAALCFLDWFAC